MRHLLLTSLVMFLSLSIVACNNFSRRDAGMVAGGVVGGAAGHALTGGSAVGTVAGAVGGGYVGRQLAR